MAVLFKMNIGLQLAAQRAGYIFRRIFGLRNRLQYSEIEQKAEVLQKGTGDISQGLHSLSCTAFRRNA